jgi:maleate isomerase
VRRLRVGVLTPHAAPGPEIELPALSQGRVSTVLVRAGSPKELGAAIRPEVLEQAASTFRAAQVEAVVHASTTTGYLIGAAAESALVADLARLCGVPAFTSCAAAVAALEAEGVRRVQLVHPPWFTEAFDDLGADYFRSRGLQAAVTKATELPDDPALVTPDQVVDWVLQHLQDDVEGVYLAGNGFRTAAAVDEIQRRTGKVVISANQALLKAVLSNTTSPR